MKERSPRRWKFGPFILDPAGVELRRGDEVIPLRPKCFDLLLYFVQNSGRLIGKDELLREIWRDVIVNEETITRTVASLRSSLGDDPENPLYIETISRRGYKFVAEVERPTNEVRDVEDADFALIDDEREFPLRNGEHLIGRGQDVAIRLYGPATSRHHARVVVSGMRVTVEDLHSRNGTFVNGTAVTSPRPLQSGDEVRIGTHRLILWSRSGLTETDGLE